MNLTYILLYNDQITVISYRRKHLIHVRKLALTNKAIFISTFGDKKHFFTNWHLNSTFSIFLPFMSDLWFNIYIITTVAFRISKINHDQPSNAVIHICPTAYGRIIIFVQLRVIYVWNSECYSNYSVYYII